MFVHTCGCQFSTWVRPGKRTPPSVKFPLGNSGFSGDLVGSVLYTLKGPSKVANCHLQVSQPHLLLFFVFILLIQARHKIMIENVPELGCLGDS